MIVGLLDVKWETRHGCSLGLMGVLGGLGLGGFPNQSLSLSMESAPNVADEAPEPGAMSSSGIPRRRIFGEGGGDGGGGDPSVLDSKVQVCDGPSTCTSLGLPQYLVEDIICTGLCLLMLDRFIDLHSSSSISISPAKEVSSAAHICALSPVCAPMGESRVPF